VTLTRIEFVPVPPRTCSCSTPWYFDVVQRRIGVIRAAVSVRYLK
jgi:hypothetical protein